MERLKKLILKLKEIVPVEIDSEDENDSSANIRAPPNSSNFSIPNMETL